MKVPILDCDEAGLDACARILVIAGRRAERKRLCLERKLDSKERRVKDGIAAVGKTGKLKCKRLGGKDKSRRQSKQVTKP